MERDANYAAVGAFVLLIGVLGALFVYWYSDSREHRHYTRYEIYFEGSVSGLSRGGAVRYLGVDVGRVVDMQIDPRDSSRVQVIVDIDSMAPISQKTAAELSLQGVTGLLYIDLITNTANRRLLPLVASEQYPVIRSARSSFDVFLSSLPELVGLANEVVERANKLLSDENIAAISNSLRSINQASSQLPATMQDIKALAADLRGATREVRGVAQNAHDLVGAAGPGLVSAVKRANDVVNALAEASTNLNHLIEDNRNNVNSFAREGLPEFERFVREGREAASSIRELAHSLREDPSQLIYQPPPRGVEIPQ